MMDKRMVTNKLLARKQRLDRMQKDIVGHTIAICVLAIIMLVSYASMPVYNTPQVTPVIVTPLHDMTHAVLTLKVTSNTSNPWMPTKEDGTPNYITWMGSGVLIDHIGTVITANHVVQDAKTIVAVDYNGCEYEVEYFKGCEYADLGVVQLKPPTPLPIVSLAEANVEVGDTIYICGSSLGDFTNSLSKGIVGYPSRLFEDMGYSKPVFQTDSSAYPGNSGGPVYNANGEVVGILVAGIDSGMTFAVPIDQVRAFYDLCIADRYLREFSCQK